jgi:epoxyqueuosine reductase
VSGNKLLLHVCCAHCAAYTVTYWRRLGHEVTALWYNPNIHPFTEHEKRRTALGVLADHLALPLREEPVYDMPAFFTNVPETGEARCAACFRLRLTRTAHRAREMGYGAFSTTLLISPHQRHELLGTIGREVARETGLTFLEADLRKYYSESRRLTKPLDLYRQSYCGCLFSERERYRPAPEINSGE